MGLNITNLKIKQKLESSCSRLRKAVESVNSQVALWVVLRQVFDKEDESVD